MKRTILHLKKQNVNISDDLIEKISRDVFDIIPDISQTYNYQKVKKIIVDKIQRN